MDTIRYSLGVVTLIGVPLGLLYWLIIHPFARRWQRLGAGRTWLIVLPPLCALGVLLFHMRDRILGRDLGTNWSLITVALLLCCPMTLLEIRYWRQLRIRTLVGLPELSGQEPGKLLQDGIYGVVRHPRYLSAGVGLIVNLLIANYAGLYLLVLAALLPGYLMLRLEERELVQRFGDRYRDYQARVPQLIPRLTRRSY